MKYPTTHPVIIPAECRIIDTQPGGACGVLQMTVLVVVKCLIIVEAILKR